LSNKGPQGLEAKGEGRSETGQRDVMEDRVHSSLKRENEIHGGGERREGLEKSERGRKTVFLGNSKKDF